jgi:hypothetical protein
MGRVGKKQKKIHANKKDLKCENTYLKKNIHTQLTNWKKNANIKNLPHPSHHFSNGRSLNYQSG